MNEEALRRIKARTPEAQRLDLSAIKLDQLPQEITELPNLKTLYLRANHLSDLPKDIQELSQLTRLDLRDNQLTTLPPEIGYLTNLRELNLADNQLASLPPEIGCLTRLQVLNVSGNCVKTLPPEIGKLTQINQLYLQRNELSELPAEIGALTDLATLELDQNQLSHLPEEICNLTKLQELDLTDNQLKQLPQAVDRLSSLAYLYLANNKLASLPAEVGRLKMLMVISLSGNPWNDTFVSLVNQGTEHVLTYLRSLLEEGKSQYEAKLLLVGEGNVGKTSLVASLMGESFVENRITTHGIEIGRIDLPHPQPSINQNITLNTWDFGGQEVYRVTHQFFFTRRSLYLMVWNPRGGMEENKVESWLKQIQLSVPDARVILVATHCKARRADINMFALRQKYGPMICSSFEVDNSDGTGIEALRSEIAAQASLLPQMGEQMNPRWVASRDALLALRHDAPQITRQQMIDVFLENQLKQHEVPVLSELLQDLGHIIHFAHDDGLRDLVVLQPEWLTKAISYVLEDRVTAEARGILLHSRLRHLWFEHDDPQRDQYDPSFHPYFLRLMEKFDICYRSDDGKRSLIAQMVPHKPPPFQWDTQNKHTLYLSCVMEDSPPGLMPWLTVRNHRFSSGQHWRRGVFLEHQAHEALISHGDRRLDIEVRGESPSHFMSLLQDSLEYLIKKRWPGLKYALKVPCPNLEDGDQCAGIFALEKLKKARSKGLDALRCLECLEEQPISLLLTGFDVAGSIKHHIADLTAQVRILTRVTLSESREGPRLFSVHPYDPNTFDITKITQPGLDKYKLTLWCEHPGHWHPIEPDGIYVFDQPREWLVKSAPYIGVAAKALHFALSALVPGSSLFLNAEARKAIEPHLQLMSKMSSYVTGELELDTKNPLGLSEELSPAEGASLRDFHYLLSQLDPSKHWAGLRRVMNQAGDLLWVCPDHYPFYDQGLPDLS